MATDRKCEACGKLATFRCPKCSELKLPDSLFCSQECFKGDWANHKKKHAIANLLANAFAGAAAKDAEADEWSVVDRFASYRFTGPLRPGKLSPKRTVPESIPRPDYATDPAGNSKLEDAERGKEDAAPEVKTPAQIEGMRAACKVGREVLDIAAKAVRPGVTTDELDRIVHEATVERGAYPSPLGYRGFPKSVCTSVNEVITHGIPDSRELVEGDIVNIDVTCYYHGFHGDLNETYPVGEIDAESKRLIKNAYECIMKAIEIVRPGEMYSHIGDVISRHAHKQGFEPDRRYVGHGIGALFHTRPSVPHYAKNRAPGMMVAGHTFTIEPMINAGTYADTVWPDDWTVVTTDGKRSAQFEHTLLVTPTGYEILTARTADSYPYWFLKP